MMKKTNKIVVFIFCFSGLILSGCPTCVGKVSMTSPPFFSREFYQPYPPSISHPKHHQHATSGAKKYAGMTLPHQEVALVQIAKKK